MKKNILKNNKKNIFLILIILVTIIILSYFLIPKTIVTKTPINQRQMAGVITAQESTTTFPVAVARIIKPFSYLNLVAKGAIVYDINNDNIIFSQQKDTILPIASITKLMTIYTASKFFSDDTVITILPEDIKLDGTTSLIPGERWSFKNLIAFTLVSSSNAGANAIAREIQNQLQINFTDQMNGLAKEIGLQNTFFRNVTGLDSPDLQSSGADSTPQEIAYLYSYIYKNNPKLLTDTNKKYLTVFSLDGLKHPVTNTNEIIETIPNLISSKTGTTVLAGGNLTIIFSPIQNQPVVIVVMGGTSQGRFVDMKKLINDTIRLLN